MRKSFSKAFLIFFLIFLIFLTLYSYYQNKDIYLKVLSIEPETNSLRKEEVKNQNENAKDFSDLIKIAETNLFRVYGTEENKFIGVGVLLNSDVLVTPKIEDSKLFSLNNDNTKSDILNNLKNSEKQLSFLKIKDSKNQFKPLNPVNLNLGSEVYILGFDSIFNKVVRRGIVSSISLNRINTDFNTKDLLGAVLFANNGQIVGLLNSEKEIVPISVIYQYYLKNKDKLEKELKPSYLGIGFEMKNLKDYVNKGQPIGPIITGVVSSSPASEIGLTKNDIIFEINGIEIESKESLENFINESLANDEVSIKVFRSGEVLELKGKLGEKK